MSFAYPDAKLPPNIAKVVFPAEFVKSVYPKRYLAAGVLKVVIWYHFLLKSTYFHISFFGPISETPPKM